MSKPIHEKGKLSGSATWNAQKPLKKGIDSRKGRNKIDEATAGDTSQFGGLSMKQPSETAKG